MNKKQYCQKLLDYRGKRMTLRLFLGGRWIFLKVVLLGMGLWLVLSTALSAKIVGGIVIGYALGKIAAGLMSYRVSTTTWPFTNDLLDWDRVAECATLEDGETQHPSSPDR